MRKTVAPASARMLTSLRFASHHRVVLLAVYREDDDALILSSPTAPFRRSRHGSDSRRLPACAIENARDPGRVRAKNPPHDLESLPGRRSREPVGELFWVCGLRGLEVEVHRTVRVDGESRGVAELVPVDRVLDHLALKIVDGQRPALAPGRSGGHVQDIVGGSAERLFVMVRPAEGIDCLVGGEGTKTDLADDRTQLVIGPVLPEASQQVAVVLVETFEEEGAGVVFDLPGTGGHGVFHAPDGVFTQVRVLRGLHPGSDPDLCEPGQCGLVSGRRGEECQLVPDHIVEREPARNRCDLYDGIGIGRVYGPVVRAELTEGR